MKRLLVSFIYACFIISCGPSVKSGGLYGKWDYIKIEHPNRDRPDMAADELKQHGASVKFSEDSTFVISWDGKPLSQGKFNADGDKIQLNEKLPDGSARSYEFYVTKATATEITFETKGSESSRVTAVKE